LRSKRGTEGEDQNAAVSSNRSQFCSREELDGLTDKHRYWLDAFKEENIDGNLDARLRYTLFYPAFITDFGDKTCKDFTEIGANEAWFRKGSRDYYRFKL